MAATSTSKTIKELRPLWVCPKCGHKLVTTNMSHSCSNYPLSYHFKGKDPIVRELFDRYLALVKTFGPVTVVSQKTRICFQVRVRFAGAVTRKHWLDCGLWLKRQVNHPFFYKTELYGKTDYVYRFRLTKAKDLRDSGLQRLLREAYAVGCQEHLRQATESQH